MARALIGRVVRHGETAGLIVETEAYHESEPACHAYVGRTPRTLTLFGPPGLAYVYRSYGVHAMLNAVAEPEGIGAAVLIRALEPLAGIELMRERRGRERVEDLCSGPGKLTQALGIGLAHNGGDLRARAGDDHCRAAGAAPGDRSSRRIGITRAIELPWRYSVAGSRFVSRRGRRGSLAARRGAIAGGAPPPLRGGDAAGAVTALGGVRGRRWIVVTGAGPSVRAVLVAGWSAPVSSSPPAAGRRRWRSGRRCVVAGRPLVGPVVAAGLARWCRVDRVGARRSSRWRRLEPVDRCDGGGGGDPRAPPSRRSSGWPG